MIILSVVAGTPAYPSFLRFEPGNKYFISGTSLYYVDEEITMDHRLWFICYEPYQI